MPEIKMRSLPLKKKGECFVGFASAKRFRFNSTYYTLPTVKENRFRLYHILLNLCEHWEGGKGWKKRPGEQKFFFLPFFAVLTKNLPSLRGSRELLHTGAQGIDRPCWPQPPVLRICRTSLGCRKRRWERSERPRGIPRRWGNYLASPRVRAGSLGLLGGSRGKLAGLRARSVQE